MNLQKDNQTNSVTINPINNPNIFQHFADYHLNSLSRGKYSKTTADYAFAKKRKLHKQNAILPRTRSRDWYAGDKWMILNTEEIATLWHFPHKQDQYSARLTKKSAPKRKPKNNLRAREGYAEENLISGISGDVPDELPVEDDKPLAYK